MMAVLIGDAATPWHRFEPIQATEFDRVKASANIDATTASLDERRNAAQAAAVRQRGHSGDTTYLQGCDLTDWGAEYTLAELELIVASPNWASYAAALRSAQIAPPDRPTGQTPGSVAQSAFQIDQEARRRFSAPLPEGPVGNALLTLRLVSQCDMDLAHGQWLDSPEARDLFATTTDVAVLHDLYILALHADHLPRLQDDYARLYLERRVALNLPVEPGLRLKDRSLINLGLPQLYATGVICEAGRPVFAGKTDLTAANKRRADVGLPPEDLDVKASEKFCG